MSAAVGATGVAWLAERDDDECSSGRRARWYTILAPWRCGVSDVPEERMHCGSRRGCSALFLMTG